MKYQIYVEVKLHVQLLNKCTNIQSCSKNQGHVKFCNTSVEVQAFVKVPKMT